MKNSMNFFKNFFALLMALAMNAISSLDHGASGPRFIVTQNPLAGRSRGSIMNMVATTWKGLNVLKGKPISVSNPQTTGQTDQRTKFTAVREFASAFLNLVQIGFKDLAIQKSEYNACISYNIQNAITGSSGSYSLDVSEARLSQGQLLHQEFSAPTSPTVGEIYFTWESSEGTGNALAADKLVIAISSDIATKVKSIISDVLREDDSINIDLPSQYYGDTVDVWAFFVSADGLLVSTSSYVGQVTVTAS